MGARRGVTLTELLVTIASLVCLTAALVPAVVGTKDVADRTVCAVHLASLGQAMALYAMDHDGRLPDCGAASPLGGEVPKDGWHFPSRFDAPGTCAWPEVRSVGNQANLWLLIREGYTMRSVLICPATADRPSLNPAAAPAVMGFLAMDPTTGRAEAAEDGFLRCMRGGRCSYSYQNQFAHPDSDAGGVVFAPPTTVRAVHPARLAILADRNPYTRTDLVLQPVVSPDDYPEANSLNHHGTGQNVLYLGGEVEWHDTPFCGAMRAGFRCDNIYWPDAGRPDDPYNVPRATADSFLVP